MSPIEPELRDAIDLEYENHDDRPGNVLALRTVDIARTSQTVKTATIRTFANHEELTLEYWNIERAGSVASFFQLRPNGRWTCTSRMNEMGALMAFLTTPARPSDPGAYVIIPKQSVAAELVDALSREGADSAAETVVRLLARPDVVEALARTGEGVAGSALVTRRRQWEALRRLEELVANPDSSEADLHAALKDQMWLFGGRYVEEFPARNVSVHDQLDIPLLRADGSFHVVELKKAKVSPLLKSHRGVLIPASGVHEAVAQTMAYLQVCDDDHDVIRRRLGTDTRRATATIVIGHSVHADGVSADELLGVFRDYSSQLSRIDVISYEELIAGAHAALALT